MRLKKAFFKQSSYCYKKFFLLGANVLIPLNENIWKKNKIFVESIYPAEAWREVESPSHLVDIDNQLKFLFQNVIQNFIICSYFDLKLL